MVYPIPTILEEGTPDDGGQRIVDTSGTTFFITLVQVSGLTAGTYSATPKTIPSGALREAWWRYTRLGGMGCGYFEFHSGIADMDTMLQSEWELKVCRGSETSVWYKGRIVNFEVVSTREGLVTKIWTEGYVSKLSELVFTATIAAGQTVKQAVQTILDTYVTPNTRIKYHADDIVGSYTLVGTLAFKSVTVLRAMHDLALLQGSTEWGVTEGGSPPAFYFKAASSTPSENMNFILGNNVIRMQTEGEFKRAYNEVLILGGISSGSPITASSSDATAQAAYGVRQLQRTVSMFTNATDAARYAANLVSLYKDGNGRYSALVSVGAERLEPDRTNPNYGTGSPTIPVSGTATFRGADGASLSAAWNNIVYEYAPQCATRLRATITAGLPYDTVDREIVRLNDKIDNVREILQGVSGGGSGPGSGTTNVLPKWDGSGTTLTDSAVSDNGTNVTITSRHLLFSADNTYDIGAQNATRPRNIYCGPQGIVIGGSAYYNQGIVFPNDFVVADTGKLSLGTRTAFWLDLNSTEVVVNDGGLSMDFRVEGDTLANLLFVDGSADRIGINTNAPNGLLSVAGKTMLGNVDLSSVMLDVYTGSAGTVVAIQTNGITNGQTIMAIDQGGASVTGDVYGFKTSISCTSLGAFMIQQNGTGRAVLYALAASTGDAQFTCEINGVTSWSVGVDNSDSDSFKVTPGAALGTGDLLTITTAGITTVVQTLRVGTATDTSTQGDFVAGLTGAGRFFYDQSSDAFAVYNSLGNVALLFSGLAGLATVFNETGADIDVRIEGDTDTSLFFVDASTDRVGVGTNAPSTKFHVVGNVTVTGDCSISGKLTVTGLIDPTGLVLTEQASTPWTPAAGYGAIYVKNTTPSTLIFVDDTGAEVTLGSGGSESAANKVLRFMAFW